MEEYLDKMQKDMEFYSRSKKPRISLIEGLNPTPNGDFLVDPAKL